MRTEDQRRRKRETMARYRAKMRFERQLHDALGITPAGPSPYRFTRAERAWAASSDQQFATTEAAQADYARWLRETNA